MEGFLSCSETLFSWSGAAWAAVTRCVYLGHVCLRQAYVCKAGRAAPMEVQAEGWEVVVGELVVPGCLQDKRQG